MVSSCRRISFTGDTDWYLRACELLSSLPRQHRTTPHLPFSPPPQETFPPASPPLNAPRPSIGEFLPSPGPGVFDPDNSIAGPSRLKGASYGVEMEMEDDILDEDEFQLARSYFDVKEFDRVVHTLKLARGKRAVFLRTYAAYLVCHFAFTIHALGTWLMIKSADRKAQEALPHFLDTKEERYALYPSLNPLILELAEETDPYLLYLRGIMLMRLDQREAAVTCFVESVEQKPYNWSCWSQMAQLTKSADMVRSLHQELS